MDDGKITDSYYRYCYYSKSYLKKAETHIDVIMPGFTHLQNAQPVLFSHYLLSFFEMFQRDKIRIKTSK